MKEMEKWLARVCWTQKSGTVLGEGQCLYFQNFHSLNQFANTGVGAKDHSTFFFSWQLAHSSPEA